MNNGRVFLGGTCNGSQWRDEMEKYLTKAGIDFFNPVVDDWNEKAQANERKEREECAFCLYTITPKMTGVYAIAEAVDDSNKRPKKTVLVILREDDHERFTDSQRKSLLQVAGIVERNGGVVFTILRRAAMWIVGEPL